MIELYDDFRDILVELHHAGAYWVATRSRSMGTRVPPRISTS
jgi:hypothetical protein